MAYLSLAILRSYLGTTSQADDELLSDCITAAQAEIDAYCRRSFEGTTGTRYYRADDLRALQGLGGSGNVLWLGKDLAALGGITNGDATTIASTDCWTEPRNAPPYQWIRLKTAEAWSFGTDGEIAVSGTWGYSTAVPTAIVQYTKEVAAYLYRMRDNPVYDVVANPESGTITVPKGMPAHVKQGLDKGGWVRKRVIT